MSEKGEADIARYKRWMEANRYPKTTVQTYVSMMIKFLKFVCPREAEECTGDDLIGVIFIGLVHLIRSRLRDVAM